MHRHGKGVDGIWNVPYRFGVFHIGEDTAAMIEALGRGMITASADKAEGVASFRAKRKPDFPGL